MYFYIFGAIIFILAFWTIGSYLAIRTIEEPAYTVIEKKNGYEIRQYEPYIVAQTTVAGTYQESLNKGFRIIADYIFGNNTTKTKIAMTVPVLEAPEANTFEKIAMTVPVIDEVVELGQRTISFVLPSQYTLETLPTPNNTAVRINEVPAQKVAVLTYTWYTNEARVASKKALLLSLLERDAVEASSSPRSALYNPPLSMPLLLRNEILVTIN